MVFEIEETAKMVGRVKKHKLTYYNRYKICDEDISLIVTNAYGNREEILIPRDVQVIAVDTSDIIRKNVFSLIYLKKIRGAFVEINKHEFNSLLYEVLTNKLANYTKVNLVMRENKFYYE
ncbi:hypothetical protein DRJ17_00225 [Candidatus Woesearchaeota archaeon]|nr:MAG: hypothetical protein DRJ17_00225 [Candidatus Woesearchaeota archaeon]